MGGRWGRLCPGPGERGSWLLYGDGADEGKWVDWGETLEVTPIGQWRMMWRGQGGAGLKPTLLPSEGWGHSLRRFRRDIGLHFGHVKLKVQMSRQRKDVEGDVGFLILELRKKRSRLKKWICVAKRWYLKAMRMGRSQPRGQDELPCGLGWWRRLGRWRSLQLSMWGESSKTIFWMQCSKS